MENLGEKPLNASKSPFNTYPGATWRAPRMQALPSHSCYMKSPDVAAFVQRRMMDIAVTKSQKAWI